MDLALWIAAGLLAVVGLTGGVTKVFVAKEKLAGIRGGEWTAGAAPGFVKSLGVLELLAALGLVLPAVTGIAPVLVPVTAACWVLLMVGAMITHVRHGSAGFATLNLAYLAVAAFVAWGRFPG
ncbi:DoxX family protein [Amycolatopsis sp. NPDC003731]